MGEKLERYVSMERGILDDLVVRSLVRWCDRTTIIIITIERLIPRQYDREATARFARQ